MQHSPVDPRKTHYTYQQWVYPSDVFSVLRGVKVREDFHVVGDNLVEVSQRSPCLLKSIEMCLVRGGTG